MNPIDECDELLSGASTLELVAAAREHLVRAAELYRAEEGDDEKARKFDEVVEQIDRFLARHK